MAGGRLSGDLINGVLSEADARSRQRGDALAREWPEWADRLAELYEPRCPRTYVPVICVMLVARALSAEIDVLRTQVKGSRDGYAAASIGKRLIPFATSQGVDLRTTSTNVLNSQPFTFKDYVTPDLSDNAHYPVFYDTAQRVQALLSAAALDVLALAFHMGRGHQRVPVELHAAPPRDTFRFLADVSETVVEFVSENSDGGRVGQAFGAALLDTVFGGPVAMKKVNDPSFSAPGDFSAGAPPWLAGEAKQTPVVTGTVTAFVDACRRRGLRRAWYLALANEPYPDNLSRDQLGRRFGDTMELRIFVSPREALDGLLGAVAGDPGEIATNLVTNLVARLEEIGCAGDLIGRLLAALEPLGFEE